MAAMLSATPFLYRVNCAFFSGCSDDGGVSTRGSEARSHVHLEVTTDEELARHDDVCGSLKICRRRMKEGDTERRVEVGGK
jgi:hypothetical protein